MFSKNIVTGLLISGFFPYLPGGLRVEHLMFPFIFVTFSFLFIYYIRIISKPLLLISFILFFGVVFAVTGSFFSVDAGIAAPVLSMGVRLIFPVIVLASMVVCLPANSSRVASIATVIVLISIPIALIAMSSIFIDISGFLNYYVKGEEDSVWSQAFSLGRFTGLFNQPLEAGIFYSVALFALIYLMSIQWWRPAGRMVILGLILVGGSLSLSKNFVVLGVLTALSYSLSVRVISLRPGIILFGILVSAIVAWLMLSDDNYANSFIQLFSDGGLLLALTAGRLGTEDTEVAQLWNHLVSSGEWVAGAGLGSYLPLDNGYLEYFYQGGILSVGCYLLFIMCVLIYSIFHWSISESKLLFFLIFFVTISSLGGPAITANRANVPLLVLMAACIVAISHHKNQVNRSVK